MIDAADDFTVPNSVRNFVELLVLLFVVEFKDDAEDADALHVEEEEEEEQSSFILSRFSITTSCSRSNSKVCACDAGFK